MFEDLHVIGDRVLIKPDDGTEKTDSGLYLPQGVQEKEKVQTGSIVKAGPGYPIPDPTSMEAEPWQTTKYEERYFPLQAKEGDRCVFLRSSGIEVDIKGQKYIIAPHSAILIVLRKGNLT